MKKRGSRLVTIPLLYVYHVFSAYDGTTGVLNGLSNTTTGVANLVSLGYNAQDLVNALTFYGSSGTSSTIASETLGYDGDLRPTSLSASWQSGSGTSGTIFAETASYDAASNVISSTLTQAAVAGQSGSGGSETQDFCYDEQNRLVWAGNSGTEPSAGNGTCGSATLTT